MNTYQTKNTKKLHRKRMNNCRTFPSIEGRKKCETSEEIHHKHLMRNAMRRMMVRMRNCKHYIMLGGAFVPSVMAAVISSGKVRRCTVQAKSIKTYQIKNLNKVHGKRMGLCRKFMSIDGRKKCETSKKNIHKQRMRTVIKRMSARIRNCE